MKRSFVEAFNDHQVGSNKRSRAEPTAHEWLKMIASGPNQRVGIGIAWLYSDVHHLLPTVQSAIALAGFTDIAEGQLWLKTMSDGSQRAVKILLLDDTESDHMEDYLAFANTIVLMQTTETLDQPTIIQRVYDIRDDQSAMWLNTPSDNDNSVMDCKFVYKIESRPLHQFNERQLNVLKYMTKNFCAQSQYLIMTSSHHQHQLGMLIDTITAAFYAGIDKQLIWLIFNDQSPCDLDVLGPLTRLGLTGDVLLKWHRSHSTHFLVVLDVVALMLLRFHTRVYFAQLPSLLEHHTNVGAYALEQIYNHPENHHVKVAIREVLNLLRLSRPTEFCIK